VKEVKRKGIVKKMRKELPRRGMERKMKNRKVVDMDGRMMEVWKYGMDR